MTKKKHKHFLTIILIVFCLFAWGVLTYRIWGAMLFGNWKTLINYNEFGEGFFELISHTIIFFILIGISIYLIKVKV